MDYRPATRYVSRSMATGDDPRGTGPALIDGLEVVDEQVVVLSPLDVDTPRQRREREARYGVG